MSTDNSWQCPYCGSHNVLTKENAKNDTIHQYTKSKYDVIYFTITTVACLKNDCKGLYLNIKMGETILNGFTEKCGDVIHEWHLLPDSNAKPFPDYIPETIRNDYEEACKIIRVSPKASAALARRCLQGIVRDYWNLPRNKMGNLASEIDYIKDKCHPRIMEAIDAVRRVGNIGAHMEKDVNLIINIESSEAESLISIIELLFEEWYITDHEREKRIGKAIIIANQKKPMKNKQKKTKKGNDKTAPAARKA